MFQRSAGWSDHDLAVVKNRFGFMEPEISGFVRNVKNKIPQSGKILDLGCGAGRHAFYFNKAGFDVYASDVDCTRIQANCARVGLTEIHIREHSFTSIPYSADLFDAICCMSTLHHAVLRESNRVSVRYTGCSNRREYFSSIFYLSATILLGAGRK